MKSVATGLLLAVLVCAPAGGQDDLTIKEETPYFPLKKNATWTYKVQGNKTFVTKVLGFEKIGSDVCAKLETRREKDNELVATEAFTVRTDGVYRRSFAGKVVEPGLRILALPVKANDTWKFDSKIGEEKVEGSFKVEEVKSLKVLGKTYDDVVSVTSKGFKSDNQDVIITYYFAKNYGLVRQVVEIAGSKTELELEKYEEKK
jgi:hypothetical protein